MNLAVVMQRLHWRCIEPELCEAPALQAFAYIEFLEPDAVANALLLADSTLQNRQIKVGRLLSIWLLAMKAASCASFYLWTTFNTHASLRIAVSEQMS